MGAVQCIIGRLKGKFDFSELIRIQGNSPGAVAVVIPQLTHIKVHAARIGQGVVDPVGNIVSRCRVGIIG